MRIITSIFLLGLSLQFAAAADHSANADSTGAAVVREMNLARQNPALYATFVEELRPYYNGNTLSLPGHTMLRTKEGVRAIDEATKFLRSARPQPALNLSAGMCRAAADHCADQANGRMGHSGSDWSNPGGRISRYGQWSLGWGENIAYGQKSARDIVLALIIDDGVRGRGHRKNIFNPSFAVAGAAVGSHAVYQTVCSIDFAGGYAERGQTSATLFARNF
ncbi:MAG: hypothetical protein QOI04_584 [Verrucomicrobiota bacterium]|jgi:uncharacterized protein YkwD